MCDFEDFPLISRYTRQQAVDDHLLVEALNWNGCPVMATTGVVDDYGLSDLITI